MQQITLRDMLEAGVHFGHQTRYWHPKMAQYIFGIRQGIHIVDLDKSLPLLQTALKFIQDIASKNGKILFVGTKRTAQTIIREEAIRCGMPYVNYRWLGGMLTNYKTIRQSIKYLKELEAIRDSGSFADFTKKEALNMTREITKLENNLGGIKNMGGLPDVIFVIDVGHERMAVSESKRLSIPVIGVVDTNHNPQDIDYIIPGNDDAMRAIRFYANLVAETIIEAKAAVLHSKSQEERETENLASRETKSGKRIAPKKVTVKTITKSELLVEGARAVGEEEAAQELEEGIDADKPRKKKIVKIVRMKNDGVAQRADSNAANKTTEGEKE